MTSLLPLAAALSAALVTAGAAPLPPVARAAVERGVGFPGAHAELLELVGAPPPPCALTTAELSAPLSASGRVPLRLAGTGADGKPCEAWAWAYVRVQAPTLVTKRAVAEGEELADAVQQEEQEIRIGRSPLASLPEGATAARALPAGARLDEGALRVGPRPGGSVSVVLRAGSLMVEQRGQAAACRRGRACAILPNGRRVEGIWHDGRIEIDSP